MDRDKATSRHRLASPAFPPEVAKASRETRRAMRWPMMITAGLILLALTGTIAVLVVLRPTAAAAALVMCGTLLLFRTRRPGQSYDRSIGWVYRYGILGGVVGEFSSQTLFRTGPVPTWLWVATDAFGVGGAIGLGVALASSSSVVVLTFLHASASFRRSDNNSI